MSRYTSANVRHQLELLGFQNVSDAILTSFLEKLQAEERSEQSNIGNESILSSREHSQHVITGSETNRVDQEKSVLTPWKSGIKKMQEKKSHLKTPPVRIPLSEAIVEEERLYGEWKEQTEADRDFSPTSRLRRRVGLDKQLVDNEVDQENYGQYVQHHRTFLNEAVTRASSCESCLILIDFVF